jgi:hypothetical protein
LLQLSLLTWSNALTHLAQLWVGRLFRAVSDWVNGVCVMFRILLKKFSLELLSL